MTYKDEPEYYDDDDYEYEDDEYEDEDDDEDESLGRYSSSRSDVKPFGGGLPGNRPQSPGASPFSRPAGGFNPPSSRPGGGTSPQSPQSPGAPPQSPGGAGNIPGAPRSDKPGGSGGLSSSFGQRPPGTTFSSKPSTGPLGSGSKPAGGGMSSMFGAKPSTPTSGSNIPGSKPPGSPSSGFSSKKEDTGSVPSASKFGVTPFSPGAKKDEGKPASPQSPSADKKTETPPAAKQVDKPAGGGLSGAMGGFASRLPFGGKKDDAPAPAKPTDSKKDDKSAGSSGLGGFGARLPFGGKKDDAPAPAKPADAKPAGSSALGGFASRLPFGGKKDDAPAPAKPTDSKKDDKSASGGALAGAVGGFASRLPFGGKKEDAPAPAKPGSPPAAKMDAQAASKPSPFGGVKLPFGGKKEEPPAAKPASPPMGKAATPAAPAGAKAQSPFGAARQAEAAGDKKGAATKATAAPASGGIGGRLGRLFGRGAATAASPARQRASRVPTMKPTTADDGGLTLDNWLDILGVAFTFGSLVLFFSALSQEQAAIGILLNFLGQLFGWGALAVPVTMFLIGMWLIVRHFGDDAPTIDPIRVAGVLLAYITLLVALQYADTFTYDFRGVDPNIFERVLVARLQDSWREYQAGGGWIGANLYYFLYATFTEIGGIFVLIFVGIFSGMLITRLTAAEIAVIVMGIWRNFRDNTKQKAAARRVQRQLEAQRIAEVRQAQPNIRVDAPAPEALAAGVAAVAALPEPAAIEIPARSIRFNRGGELVEAGNAPAATAAAVSSGVPTSVPPVGTADSGGNLFSRFRRPGSKESNSSGFALPPIPKPSLLGRSGDKAPAMPELPMTPLPHDDDLVAPALPTAALRVPDVAPARPMAVETPLPTTPIETAPTLPPAETAPRPADTPSATTAAAMQILAASSFSANPLEDDDDDDEAFDNGFNAKSTAAPAIAATPDPLQARQDRLNALRGGMTTPPAAQSPVQPPPQQQRPPANPIQPAKPAEQPAARYNPFGRPEDIPTHPSEKLPYADRQFSTPASQLPSAQAQSGGAQPYQSPLSIPPTQAGSSTVTNQTRARKDWKMPDFRTLLSSGSDQEVDRALLLRQAKTIEETLESFGAPGRVVEINTGPVITQFGVEPDYLNVRGGKKQRVKVSAIAALDKDLQLSLGARSIRVEAPVPGKGYVGIEVPNAEPALVSLRDVMESPNFQKHKSPLAIALGQSVSGAPISADLGSMPHLLIAGTTGSGKSVCVNAIITSILALNSPEQVKFIMVDPKRVELTGYNGIPHLVAPVVVELERIVGVLKWVTREMDERYRKFSEAGARNIEDYNKHRDINTVEQMPYIIVIIDELADLMMLAPEETERTITRIAALARATGIHLVIATQRPSVDVVTGLIKANFPARIAFAVAGGVDSRVILDQPGAERLLGRGDMLYMSGDSPAPLRLQGVYVSDMEIQNIVRYWKLQALEQPEQKPVTIFMPTSAVQSEPVHEVKPRGERVRQQSFWDSSAAGQESRSSSMTPPADDYGGDGDDGEIINGDALEDDELYEKAVELVRRLDKASVSLLQRRLRIGYTRAARMIDVMEARGVVGPAKDGSSKPRDVLPQK